LGPARSTEEDSAGKKGSGGEKNQAENNEENLAGLGWSCHSGIVELLEL